MGAGGGYSTELMARAVGPDGKVYGQDYETSAARQGALRGAHEDRCDEERRRAGAAVRRSGARGGARLDLITFFFFYHDTTYMAVDRAAMNKKLFAALKPGGFLIIADHSAKAGRRHFGRQDPASDRGGALERRRGRRFQALAAGRVPAPSGGPARRDRCSARRCRSTSSC